MFGEKRNALLVKRSGEKIGVPPCRPSVVNLNSIWPHAAAICVLRSKYETSWKSMESVNVYNDFFIETGGNTRKVMEVYGSGWKLLEVCENFGNLWKSMDEAGGTNGSRWTRMEVTGSLWNSWTRWKHTEVFARSWTLPPNMVVKASVVDGANGSLSFHFHIRWKLPYASIYFYGSSHYLPWKRPTKNKIHSSRGSRSKK